MTTTSTPTPSAPTTLWRKATAHQLFWPVAVLVALLLVNVPFTPGFFAIHLQDGHLYGSLVSIVLFGSPLILVALGMTLVIATGGIDLSVGAVVAISGALACLVVSKQADQGSVSGVLLGFALALAVSLVLGAWNGLLVARLGIQPIIATLILMVAGRGVAQLITDGQIITVNSSAYALIGGGYWLTLPFSIFVVTAVVALTMVLTRRTALGLLVEAVGGNAEASRLVGIRSRRIKIMVYMFCGLCAGIAGLMISSNVSAADGNSSRPVDRARRHPRRRHRRHLAHRRPIPPRRHHHRRADHPDPDHHHLHDRRPHPDQPGLQGRRRHHRLPAPVPGVPRQGLPLRGP